MYYTATASSLMSLNWIASTFLRCRKFLVVGFRPSNTEPAVLASGRCWNLPSHAWKSLKWHGSENHGPSLYGQGQPAFDSNFAACQSVGCEDLVLQATWCKVLTNGFEDLPARALIQLHDSHGRKSLESMCMQNCEAVKFGLSPLLKLAKKPTDKFPKPAEIWKRGHWTRHMVQSILWLTGNHWAFKESCPKTSRGFWMPRLGAYFLQRIQW